MSRTLLAFTSALLLATASCAEEEAMRPPGSPDAGGMKPGPEGEPDDDEAGSDGGPTASRKPDASTDAGRRTNPTATGGLDAGSRAPGTPPGTAPGAATPSAGGPAVVGSDRTGGNTPAGQPGPTIERVPSPGPDVEQQNPPEQQNPSGPQVPPGPQDQAPTQVPEAPPNVIPDAREDPRPPPAPEVPEVSRVPVARPLDEGVRSNHFFTNGEPIYFDLESGGRSVDLRALPGWDLALFGTNIMLNGGNGSGRAAAVVLNDVGFDAVRQAPAAGWRSDAGSVDEHAANFVLSAGDGAWFYLDPATGIYTPQRRVYVIRTIDGAYFKLAVLGYYDADQNPGRLALQWAAVSAP